MTSDESVRGERLLHAASLGLQVGRLDQVTSLLGQIEGLTLGPQAARRSRLLFWAGWPPAPGDPAGSLEVVDEALRSARDGDRDTAVELLLLAARTEAFAGREQSSAAHVVAALDAVGDRADDPRCLLIRAFASPLRSGSEVIRGAKSARSIELDADGLTSVAMACMWVHATNVAAPFLDRAADALRQRGDLHQLAELLVVRAWAGFFMGKWDNGITDAAEGGRLSRETQQPIYAAVLDVLHAMLLRLRGGDVDFPESMTAAERTGLSGGGAAVLNVVQLARGLASMAQGSYGTAFEQLVRIYAPQDPAYHRFHGCRWLTYLAEAAVHADRIADARAIVSEIEPLIELTDAEALHISLRYAHAVLADEAEAEQLYLRALSADLADWPLDQARLNLAWGAWLRRRRRAAESRDPLRRARDTFESIGAMYWAERARRELRAAGERSGDPAVQQKHGLTAQELQIAQLAAQGWSNREIGQQIYVSHRTVGSHLYRIFPKLGITSRQQLSQVLIDSR
jgi:DNA-binding CsgD family transcriptional regulator